MVQAETHMMRWFGRKSPSDVAAPASPARGADSFDMRALPILDAPALLAHCGYDAQLTSLFRAFGIGEQHFDVLVRRPVHRFAEAVQLAPASENNHHCGPGGLLQHTLEVITAALQVRRGFQLPIGGSPDVMAQEEHVWTYGVFVSCLFHDIGKVLSRFQIVLNLPDGSRRIWTPHDVPLRQTGAASYQIRFVESPYKAHQRLSVTLYGAMLPKTARAWLMQNAAVMSQTLAAIWGDGYESGVIGEIMVRADRESTSQNRDIEYASRRFAGAKESVADRLIQKLRQLLSEREIKLNQSGAMAWVAGEHTYFVCRPLAEKLLQALKEDGEKGIPKDPLRIYDVLQEHGFALPYEDGKAIRKVRVEGEGWSHTLTCLKFETRRLWLPVRLPAAFDGKMTEVGVGEAGAVSESAPETVKTSSATTAKPERASETAPKVENATATEPADEAGAASEDAEAGASQPSGGKQSESEGAGGASRASETGAVSETASEADDDDAETAAVRIPELAWEDDVGTRFWQWLREAIRSRTLQANNQKAQVHYVEEGVFLVTPRLFKDFAAKSGLGPDEFTKLQKRFCRLNVHKKTERTHHNVHPYVVMTANRTVRLNGFLIPYSQIFEADEERPERNEYLVPFDLARPSAGEASQGEGENA